MTDQKRLFTAAMDLTVLLLHQLSPELRAEFVGSIPFCSHCGADLAEKPNGICHCESDE